MSVITEGGPVMMVVAGLGGLGVLVALGLTGLGISKKRVPLAVWLLVPLLALTVGAIGAWMAAGTALTGLDTVASTDLPSAAKEGFASALLPDWFGRWVGAGLMALAAWGAGLGASLRGDEDSRATWFSSAMALFAAVAFAAGCGVYSWMHQLGTPGYAVAALLAFGGAGVAVGSFRRHLHDHAFRVAGMRFASGLALIFAVSWAGKAVVLGNSIDLANKLAVAGGSTYAATLEAGVTLGGDLNTLGWIALAGAWVIAMFAFFAELGDVVQKGTLFDMAGVIALLLGSLAVRTLEGGSTSALESVSNLEPLAEVMSELGYDLPGSVAYDGDGNIKDARPTTGGFGDVISWDKDSETWFRLYAWNGAGWTTEAEGTKLADVTLDTTKSLLIVAKGDVAVTNLFEPMSKVGNKALLLGRLDQLSDSENAGVKANEGVLVPIAVTEGPNFAEEFWMDGDTGRIYEGPVLWYGKGFDGKKLYQRIGAAYEMPEAVEGEPAPNPRKGLHVVAGERTRIKNIFEECVPVIVAEKEGKFVGNERYCNISKVEIPEDSKETHVSLTVAKAMEGFEAPRPDNVRMTYKAPREVDAAVIKTVLDREIGAFGFCGTTAGADAQITGRLQFKVYVGMNGRVDSIVTGERSQVESMPVIDCAKKRIRPMAFTEHEVEDDDKMPFIELTLTYR